MPVVSGSFTPGPHVKKQTSLGWKIVEKNIQNSGFDEPLCIIYATSDHATGNASLYANATTLLNACDTALKIINKLPAIEQIKFIREKEEIETAILNATTI